MYLSRAHRHLTASLLIALSGSLASAQIIPTPTVFSAPQGTPASVADLVEAVSPAVVNIVVRSETGETTSEGQGSGFLISEIGEVVTNYHVIEGGSTITVVFNNGEEFNAQIIGTDEETDLALLKINSDQPFPPVKFYEGDPIRIGDWVIAIGNPFGIGQSTSVGIISAIGRDRVESGAYVDYIQTDATINRGNSGGPLFNPYGQVVGVNSAIFSPTGASVGIAFAIPHQTAKEVIDALRKDGRVRRAWLGVGLRTAEYSGGETGAGAHVNNVVPGGPAHLNGLQIDDIILQINGQSVANATEATRLIGRIKPGTAVDFTIERDEQIQSLRFRMAERPGKDEVERSMNETSPSAAYSTSPTPSPAPLPYRSPNAATGMSLVDLSSTFRQSIGMRYDQVGVYVEQVSPGSNAERRGIRSNMVILEADQEPVASVSAFNRKIEQARRAGQSDILLLMRLENGSENYVSLSL